MSDDVKTNSAAPRQSPHDLVDRIGDHRIDGPHHTPAGSVRKPAPETDEESLPVDAVTASQAAETAPTAANETPPQTRPRELGHERVLLQASQIAEHLSTQYAELDRREQRLNGQLALLDQERRSVRLWVSQFEEEAEEREARLLQQEADCTERLKQCAELEHQLEQQRQELVRTRGELDAQRDEQAAEFQREQTLLKNRVQFQEEHLKKARHELERNQEEFRREQQRVVQQRQQTAEGFRLQRQQAERFRDLLEQREKSLVRERDLIRKIRRAHQDQHDSDKQCLLNERDAWNRERETQQAEMKRQQNMLKLHAENLEARRLRLDRLRAELEETHRKTLEMRLAVEEAWAQLSHSTGPDVAKQRVDEAQAALSQHYKQAREDLIQHRQELERAQLQYQKQRDEFRDERQALAEWVTERTEQLQNREKQVAGREQALESREQTWHEKQDRWTQEKAEAEAVIRDLLRQLTENGATDATPAAQPDAAAGDEISAADE